MKMDKFKLLSLDLCPTCKRALLPIGINDLPRRCPVCAYVESYVSTVKQDLEERTL